MRNLWGAATWAGYRLGRSRGLQELILAVSNRRLPCWIRRIWLGVDGGGISWNYRELAQRIIYTNINHPIAITRLTFCCPVAIKPNGDFPTTFANWTLLYVLHICTSFRNPALVPCSAGVITLLEVNTSGGADGFRLSVRLLGQGFPDTGGFTKHYTTVPYAFSTSSLGSHPAGTFQRTLLS